MISKEEIENRLWEGANELICSMDASRYKDYMLGIMFYKFLSDKTLQSFAKISGSKLTGHDLYLQYKEKVMSYQKDDTSSFKNNPVFWIEFTGLQEHDVASDVYEYFIGKFAMESGAKAGEFYIRLFQNLFNIDVCNSCTCKVA